MENLMDSIEVINRFRDSQFDIVKAGKAANSEVISVNPVFLKAGIPSPTVSVWSTVFVLFGL
jgi:amidohydrolase/aminoacylase